MTRRRQLSSALLALFAYVAAALFMTWPLAAYLSTRVAGAPYGDSSEFMRLAWWGRYSLEHGLNPFYQSLFAYPGGYFDAIQWAQPLIYWPVTVLSFLFGTIAAFNLWILIELVLAGLAAYWLCAEVVGGESRFPALIGGLIFMAFPTLQGHLSVGHVNILSVYTLPLVVLCLYRIVTGRGSIRIAVLGSVGLLILALGNYVAAVFFVLPLVLFGGGYLMLFRRRLLFRRKTLTELIILAVLAGVLILPFYVPLIRQLAAPNSVIHEETGWVAYSTDPLAFVAPSPFTPWIPAPVYSHAVLGINSIEGSAYLGLAAVLLALISLFSHAPHPSPTLLAERGPGGEVNLPRRRSIPWLIIALGCMIFSLGPLLKWGDQPLVYTLGDYHSNIVLPWAILQNLPAIGATRTPGRFNIVTGLALGILAAMGLSVVLGRVRKAVRSVLTAALIIFIAAEYQLFFPFPTTSAALPAYFDTLAARTNIRAILDLPFDDPLAQKAALYQQTAHHKPLIGGYVARETTVDPAKLAVLSDAALSMIDPAQARAILNDNGADVVIYHWGLLDKPDVLAHAAALFGPSVYQDEQFAVFEVPLAAKPSTVAVSYSPSGWWREIDPSQNADLLWLTGDGSLYVYAPQPADLEWTTSLLPLLQGRTVEMSLDGSHIRSWRVQPPGNPLAFDVQLDRGFHTLRFTLPDGCTPVPVPPICLLPGGATNNAVCSQNVGIPGLCVGVAFNGLQFHNAGAMAFQLHAVTLSNGMALLGYRSPAQATPGQAISVDTDWYAAAKLPGDYHLFVHILDQNGKQVAQADTVPGSGTFPTAAWSVPQYWDETSALTLPADLPPGKYSIYAGWYSYPDLARLSVQGDGPHAADGLVYLRDIQIGPSDNTQLPTEF